MPKFGQIFSEEVFQLLENFLNTRVDYLTTVENAFQNFWDVCFYLEIKYFQGMLLISEECDNN